MRKLFTLAILVGFYTASTAQSISFEVTNSIKVYDSNNVEQTLATIGGMNQPQFYNLDIDNDGTLDLFVFDRNGAKVISLIHDGQGNYTYEPKYDQIYPGRFTTWVVFKDYNNDSKPDLWFYSEDEDAISLYRNVTGAGDKHAMFELADADLRAYNFGDAPLDTNDLYCDRTNIPAIEDLDGDGDIDFLTLQSLGYGITLFLNNTAENGKPLDPPSFEIADQCWGDFIEYDGSNKIDFKRDEWCFHKFYRYKKKHAGGSSLLLLDMDADDDMDLLMGNAGLDNLLLLYNGKSDLNKKADSMIASDSMFPSSAQRAVLHAFPAPYYQDVDGDGIKDLLVSVNMFDKNSYTYREANSIKYYKNKGKNNQPVFELMDTMFIDRLMIDHGGHTAPLLYDMDKDGDLDMILATNGDWGITGERADYLVYYENIGTKTSPEYKLVKEDYLGLLKDSIQTLSPCLGDLNRDGWPELLVGRRDGSLCLYNIVGTGATATATKVSDNTYGINVNLRSAPFLGDVDGDGYTDLLVGSNEGYTKYYRNTSKTDIPAFSLIKDTFGGVMPGFFRMETQYDPDKNIFYDSLVFRNINGSSPALADLDGNGDPEFILGDERGQITIYRNIRTTGFDSFQKVDEAPFYFELSQDCRDYNFGANSKPVLGDLDGDGELDMVVGNERGGVMFALAGKSCNLSSRSVNRAQSVRVYPNPAGESIQFSNIQGDRQYVVIYDLLGQVVKSAKITAGDQVNIEDMISGIYLVSIESDGLIYQGKFVKK